MIHKFTDLFKIEYPIIQGVIIWFSGYKIVSLFSKSSILSLIDIYTNFRQIHEK